MRSSWTKSTAIAWWSERWAVEVTAGLPRGRLVEIPGAGHAPHWSMPEPVADAVRPLL